MRIADAVDEHIALAHGVDRVVQNERSLPGDDMGNIVHGLLVRIHVMARFAHLPDDIGARIDVLWV